VRDVPNRANISSERRLLLLDLTADAECC